MDFSRLKPHTRRARAALLAALRTRTIEIGAEDAGRCTVRVAGFAKEGLISQHAAEKGVAKLAEVLNMLKA